MAGLDGVARHWDLVAGVAAGHDAPAAIATRRPRSIGAGAIAAAVVLLLVTGFRFGAGTYSQMALDGAGATQFASLFYHDVFGVVSIVHLPDRWFAGALNPHAVFLICHLLAVYGCCFAVLRIVARLASADAIGLTAGALMIGVTYLDSGIASLSGETVVTGYFTATQLATALVALSLAFALDGSLAIAIGLLGLAFDAESAVALWGVAGLRC